jgi:3-hydroxyisobutyrate dehydrogenase-like beta-hydroxyacid dehydrogenase
MEKTTLELGFIGVGMNVAVTRGARPAGSAAEVARASELVHACVMYTDEVELYGDEPV